MSNLSVNNLNKAINNLILNVVNNYYTNDEIFFNNENNIPLGNSKLNKFVIINELYSISHTALVYNNYIPNEDTKTSIGNIKQINETFYQIDFYSNTNDSIAINSANRLAVATQSYYATSFLKEFGFSIGKAESPKNITKDLDTSIYISKFCVRFSIFNPLEMRTEIESFDAANINTFLETN